MVMPKELMSEYREEFVIYDMSACNQQSATKFIDEDTLRHLNRMRNIYRRKREVL